MLGRFWQGVRSMLAEADVPEALGLPVCDLTVTQPVRIASLMADLRAEQFVLSVQAEGGLPVGRATVFSADARSVVLRLAVSQVVRPVDGLGLRVNVAGSSPQGALMFTLDLQATRLGDLWRADLPDEILCLQSRRHRRVQTWRSLNHEARLQLPPALQGAQLLDLSEEGAGLSLQSPVDPRLGLQGATLVLDGMKIEVPNFRVMHRTAPAEGPVRLGLGLQGMAPADQRALRRWLNEAESQLLAVARAA